MRGLKGFLVSIFCLLSVPAEAERYALVIGNGDYEELDDLYNTHSDAEAYHQAFERLGFKSTLKKDLGRDEIWDALDEIAEVAKPGDQVAFVFSGHGWSDGGNNYLLPVDAPKQGRNKKLVRASLALKNGFDGVLDLLAERGVGLTIAIIDACRDNPFASADGFKNINVGRGLSRITPPQDTFVIFSAGAGQVALDRLPDDPPEQRLSVFTRHFVPLLTSNLYLRDAVLKARKQTYDLARTHQGHQQRPALDENGFEKICLAGPGQCSTGQSEQAAYLAAVTEGSADALQSFIYEHPSSAFVAAAKTQLGLLSSSGNLSSLSGAAGNDPAWIRARERCNQLAAMVHEGGVTTVELNAHSGDAKQACREALELRPNDAKMTAQLGRAYYAEENYDRALELLRPASVQDNATAQFVLGVMYWNGYGVDEEKAKALEFHHKAAKQGHPGAQINIGVAYHDGRGVSQDYSEAMRWYLKAAGKNHRVAQLNIGVLYEYGLGTQKDDNKAVKWYRKAAAQGYASGQYSLGYMYANGRGVPKDDTEAVKWYRKAAEQDYARAQTNLGFMYEKGRGVPQDDTEAVKWYRKAAEQDHARAQTNLGYMYAEGRGVSKDEVEAVNWYRKAAEQDYARAQTNLGYLYELGRGVSKDEVEAVKWYRKAANQGYARAQYYLGVNYASGTGVVKDYTEAVKWYRKAAEQDYVRAQFGLGIRYANGEGVPQDYTQARIWYRKAAEQGNVNAQWNLAMLYLKGNGVEQDRDEAASWFRKAADQGDEEAKKKLKEMGY
nr:caspase family protein [uncultured Roseibium sp.]